MTINSSHNTARFFGHKRIEQDMKNSCPLRTSQDTAIPAIQSNKDQKFVDMPSDFAW